MNPWSPLVVATLGWGLSTTVTRALLQNGVESFALVPVRLVLALATMAIFTIFSPRFRNPGRTAWKRGSVLGAISVMPPIVLMTLGLEDLPVAIGGLMIALIPISTIGAAHFLVEDERFDPRSLPGLLVSLVGTAVLVGIGGNELDGVDNLWRGVGLVVAGIVFAGIGGALSRRYAQEVTGDALVLPEFTVGALLAVALIPLFPAEGIGTWSGTDWWLMILVGILGTAAPHAAFLVGASVNPAWRLALTGYTVPVVAIILAVVFLGEKLTPAIIFGAVLIIGGVVMVERSSQHLPEPGMATSR